MEADWEMEIGGDAAIIDAAWSGFLDLRLAPERARELSEVIAFPALEGALVLLNSPASPVWTAKCDFWPQLEEGQWDPDELDAVPDDAQYAAACYLDLLPRSDQQWVSPAWVERDCRALCKLLGAIPMSNCRVDLVARRAWITPERRDTGITAYLTACAATPNAATVRLAACLAAFTHAVVPQLAAIPQSGNSTVQ